MDNINPKYINLNEKNMEKLKQLHEEFLAEQQYQVGLSAETVRGYIQVFDLFVSLVPEVTLDTLSKKHTTIFFQRLATRKRIVGRGIEKEGIRKSTIATYRSKLNKFFEWLKEEKYILKNPFKGIKWPKVKYSDTRFLKQEEIEKIFSAVSFYDWPNLFVKKRNLAIFGIALHCG